eukprot:TRINITY_DN73289_c0_g1_i1.p1 TRINITY_DN73289_c0_g1~~TRINITY_DN73289_c0_g1_i1.p1  ORF type:complete len:313 (+),score=53.30 TRINITY_DN73289_c0_g1_i1:68-940(+)
MLGLVDQAKRCEARVDELINALQSLVSEQKQQLETGKVELEELQALVESERLKWYSGSLDEFCKATVTKHVPHSILSKRAQRATLQVGFSDPEIEVASPLSQCLASNADTLGNEAIGKAENLNKVTEEAINSMEESLRNAELFHLQKMFLLRKDAELQKRMCCEQIAALRKAYTEQATLTTRTLNELEAVQSKCQGVVDRFANLSEPLGDKTESAPDTDTTGEAPASPVEVVESSAASPVLPNTGRKRVVVPETEKGITPRPKRGVASTVVRTAPRSPVISKPAARQTPR